MGRKAEEKRPGYGRATGSTPRKVPPIADRGRPRREESAPSRRPEAVYGAAAVAAPAGAGLTVAAGFLILRVGRTTTEAPGGMSGGAAAIAALLILISALLLGTIAGGVFKVLAKETDPSPDRGAAVSGFAAAAGAGLMTLLATASGTLQATPGLGFVALCFATLVGLLCGQGAYLGVRRVF